MPANPPSLKFANKVRRRLLWQWPPVFRRVFPFHQPIPLPRKALTGNLVTLVLVVHDALHHSHRPLDHSDHPHRPRCREHLPRRFRVALSAPPRMRGDRGHSSRANGDADAAGRNRSEADIDCRKATRREERRRHQKGNPCQSNRGLISEGNPA